MTCAAKRYVACTVKVPVKASIWQQVIDEEELVMAMAPSDELHEVAVPELADDGHLRVRMKTVGNGRKTPKLFSTFTFEIENESKNGKTGHENERELTNYREFRKRTNSSGFMSNTVDIQNSIRNIDP